MKRIISVLLAAVMVCTAAVIFAGCGDGNYPVTSRQSWSAQRR